MHDEFADLAARLQQMMTARLDQVAQGFAQKAALTIETMAQPLRAVHRRHHRHRQRAWPKSIAARADEVNSTLRSTGDSLVLDLSLRGGDVVSKMEQTGARITDTIVSRRNTVADTFRDSAEALVDRAQQPRRRGQGHAGGAPAGLRGHVQPRRHRADREDLARLHARSAI